MRGLTAIAAIIFVLIIFGPAGCEHYHTYRYRLTLEVETPEGIKTGSGVYEVSVSSGKANLISPGGSSGTVIGEAVIVDLAARGPMFVLLSKNEQYTYAGTLPVVVAKRAGLVTDGRTQSPKRYENLADFTREIAALRGKIEVLFDELPTLVRFRDINDPKSVELVYPTSLDTAFGSHVALRQAWIEMTSDSVTTGIEEKLAWLKTLRTLLDGTQLHYASGPKSGLANSLSNRNFIQ
jgi:hypothetical protein